MNIFFTLSLIVIFIINLIQFVQWIEGFKAFHKGQYLFLMAILPPFGWIILLIYSIVVSFHSRIVPQIVKLWKYLEEVK